MSETEQDQTQPEITPEEKKFFEMEEKIRVGLGIDNRELADFCFTFVDLAFHHFMDHNQRAIFMKAMKRKHKALQNPKVILK